MELAQDPQKKPLGEGGHIPRPKSKTEEYESPTPPKKPKIGAPAFLPTGERKHYDLIQGTRNVFLTKLLIAWNQFKEDYLATVEKRITGDQRDVFDIMLGNFNDIASEAFDKGVQQGNSYFEDQFHIKGLTPAQRRKVIRRHNSVFHDRADTLFRKDVQDKLRETPPEKQRKLLSGFDKFLLGFSAVAASVAYDVFSRNITGLNKKLHKRINRGGLAVLAQGFFPPDVVQVEWVLFDDASHSPDCINLSEGEDQDGSGVWVADTLTEMGMIPQSPNLDCGGNCRCHLSPIVQGPRFLTEWTANVGIARFGTDRDRLEVKEDISATKLLSLFNARNFIIPGRFADDIVSRTAFRRNAFWNKYPKNGISFNVKQGSRFSTGGATYVSEEGAILKTEINVTLGRGQTVANLSKTEVNEVTRIFAHEMGHTFASNGASRVNPISIGAHGFSAADEILQVAGRERAKAFAKIQSNFENALARIPQARQAELKPVADIARNFLKNPDGFIDDLFKAVEAGGTFGGVDAQEAWQLLNRTIHEFSSGTQLVRSYQLWDRGEYFADWFSILITDPAKAALHSPDLNKVMAKRFPAFFKQASVKRVQEVIPDAVATSFRYDLPQGSAFLPIGPNLDTFAETVVRFRTATKRVGNSTIQRQVQEIIRDNVNLHRKEFYKGLNVKFLDKLQIGKISGSRRNLAFFDKGTFNINYDRWRLLSRESKASLLSDIVGRHIYQKSTSSLRTRIKKEYAEYLRKTFDVLENKAGIQRLAKRPITDIRDITLGSRDRNLPRNLGFWGRNFESGIKPILKDITDLPVINVDSLASPQAFWAEWMRLYVTKPTSAGIYGPNFQTILTDFLKTTSIGKFIDMITGGDSNAD